MDLKTWRCEHDSTVRRLDPLVGFRNMAVTFLVLYSWKFLKSSRKTCTGHIHLLKFIYRLLKHNIHVNIFHVKMGAGERKAS